MYGVSVLHAPRTTRDDVQRVWIASAEGTSLEQLPGVQALLLVFACIAWVVALRVHGDVTPTGRHRTQPSAWRPLLFFAISALLVLRTLLTPENA